jgi:peptide/nickel transport system permease protein
MASNFKRTGLIVASSVLALLAFSSLLAPLLSSTNPLELHLEQGLFPPSSEHLLGQDKLGRDLLSRILYGGRVSLGVGTAVLFISMTIGMVVGTVAGFFGGWVDSLFMRLTDIFLAFPGMLLAIAMAAVLGPSIWNVVIALSVLGWPGFARLIRGQILVVREEEYILAARALGIKPAKVILRHLLPNILSPIIVEATFTMASVIMAEASLSFLGLGVQPPFPSWGGMLNEARAFLLVGPHLVIVPGIVLMMTVVALNLLGDDLRDRLDVRSRVREHKKG